LQRADGSWNLDDELAAALGWADAKQLLAVFGRSLANPQDSSAAATALALAWLDFECRDTKDEWLMLADKARQWLARTPEGADAWLSLARAALANR
jgi:hypothetical protein